MGTREVCEQKLRGGNLVYVPTMNPGLGTPRCPRCLSIIDPNSEFRDRSIRPVIREATVVVQLNAISIRYVMFGAEIGGLLSAIHNLNTGMPHFQNRFKGQPRWLPFVSGIPLMLLFSAASAAFGGTPFHTIYSTIYFCGKLTRSY